MRTLETSVTRFGWVCHAYCLMNNHYHLLLETPRGYLSEGMKFLNGVYTQGFNSRHKRPGHVFQGRFHSVIVDKDEYLLEVSRYIVLNPVRAGLVQDPGDWRWSSYLATAGIVSRPKLLTRAFLLSMFGGGGRRPNEQYVEFVLNGIGRELWDKLRGGFILGNDDFEQEVRDMLKDQMDFGISDEPREPRSVPLETIFGLQSGKADRGERICRAHVEHGYGVKEIGDFLGIHFSSVSRAIRRQLERNAKRTT